MLPHSSQMIMSRDIWCYKVVVMGPEGPIQGARFQVARFLSQLKTGV